MAKQPNRQRKQVIEIEIPENTTAGELDRARKLTGTILEHVLDIAEILHSLGDNEYSIVHGALEAHGHMRDECNLRNTARDLALCIAGRMLVESLELDLSTNAPNPNSKAL